MNRKIVEKRRLRKKIKILIHKTLYTLFIFIMGMIFVKNHPERAEWINENIFEKSFSFMKERKLYNQYFSSKPENKNETESVFLEKINYQKQEKMEHGVKLTVSNNYLVPNIESGLIIYMGEKDGIKTIILDQIDGVTVTYQNIITDTYKLYDYVEKGQILGKAEENTIMISFEKEGKEIDYKKYI